MELWWFSLGFLGLSFYLFIMNICVREDVGVPRWMFLLCPLVVLFGPISTTFTGIALVITLIEYINIHHHDNKLCKFVHVILVYFTSPIGSNNNDKEN